MAAMQAALNGKPVQWRYPGSGEAGWATASEPINLSWDCEAYDYRPKPEPKVRPWSKPEDVPLNCWLRSNRNPEEIQALVVSVSPRGVEWFTNADRFIAWGDIRWTYLEYSTDRREWKPCTVTEEA